MSAQTESGNMPFIVSTGYNKADPETRKLIRRTVMVGKNRGKTKNARMEPGSNPKKAKPRPSKAAIKPSSSQDHLAIITHTAIPKKVGSELSLIRFADTVEPSQVAVVLQFSAISKQALFILETCIRFDDQERRLWLEPLASDAAYLHAMLFSTKSYFDLLSGGRGWATSSQSAEHFSKTLRLLRERLSLEDDQLKASNTTAFVVLILAMHAYFIGDVDATAYHMTGLRRLVDLRGGITAFDSHKKLLVELLRSDIRLALHSGTRPLFFRNASLEPFLPYPRFPHSQSDSDATEYDPSSQRFLDDVDAQLVLAWNAMKEFSVHINFVAETKDKMPMSIMLDTMASVMYRLLHTHFEPGSLDDAIRLGLLAFSSSVFLQFRDLGLPYAHFSALYKDCFFRSKFLDAPPKLWMWLLMLGAIAVFGESDDAWLKPWLWLNLDACGLGSWSETRDVLQSFMWIDVVHDERGKAMFSSG